MPVGQEDPKDVDLEGLEGTTAALLPTDSTAPIVPPRKKITIQEYHCFRVVEEQWVTTFLNRDKNGEDLDYEDFEPQDNLANIQIGYRTPIPTPQIPDLLLLQDASTLAPQPATTLVVSDVTIPMLQDTIPRTIPDTVAHNIVAAASWVPSFGRGVPVAWASPMQVGMPVALPQRTPMHSVTAEDVLLQGATLSCSLWQEANLLNLNPPLTLMDNHIKMMDALCHLDTIGLQFICESVEALC